HYLRLTFWPASLVLDYEDWPVAGSAATWLPQALAIVALLGATIVALRRWPPLGFLGAFFFLLLAPSSSVLPIVTEIAAERRMYLGDLYYRAGDLPNAERHFAEAIQVKPESAESHYGLAVVLAAERKRSEAMAEYTEALRLNPRYPEAHNNLANELFALGRND